MDIEANKKEQLSVANEILDLWDCCTDDGEFTDDQKDELIHSAYRLAELVQSLHVIQSM